MRVVTWRYLANGIMVVTATLVLIVLLIGLSARITARDLLIAVLMAIGIGGAVGGLMGLLFLKVIYRSLGMSGDEVKPIATTQVPLADVSVEYELGANDALAFQLYHYERSPKVGRARKLLRSSLLIAPGVVFLAAIVLVVAVGREELSIAVGLGAWAVLMFLWALFYPSLVRKGLRAAVARDYGKGRDKLIGKHRLSITPEAVTDTTDMGQSSTRWSAVDYVASTDQHLFILVRGAGPHIVPRRAFADEAAFHQFTEMAKSFHRAASAQSTELPQSMS